MDVLKSIQDYIDRMLAKVNGMKTQIISLAFTQSQLLAKEVYLIDRIDNFSRDRLKHLKCVCFTRPSVDTLQVFVEELRNPKYAEYHLFFSNILKKSAIEVLAEADEFELVKQVQECFADYLPIERKLFSLNMCVPEYSLYMESSSIWNSQALSRCTEGILALLLSLKKKPLIRYQLNSSLAKKLATELSYHMMQEGALFEFHKPDTSPILLILDRKNDPVTPLLNQWTYQAMVHELLGIRNGRVNLSNVPGIRSEMKDVVMSAENDRFYKKSMFLNLGDLGANIKQYVEEYQAKHKSSTNIESITDMKQFVEDYPEFRKLSGNVTKHVTLVGELSRLVDKDSLLQVGELEQSLACLENHSQDLKAIQQLIKKSNVSVESKLKLIILYALRYEKMSYNSTGSLIELAKSVGVTDKKLHVIDQLILYAGADQRQEDLFSNENVFSRTKNALKGLKGVENIYTQHSPFFISVTEALIKGRLIESLYPFIDQTSRDKPQDIIIFMIGGTTFGEYRELEKLLMNTLNVRIVLGGTQIHNSQSFLLQISDSVSKWNFTQ